MSEFVSGVVFGALLIIGLSVMPGSNVSEYNIAKKACEKHLPRDEHCVIIALPVSKD